MKFLSKKFFAIFMAAVMVCSLVGVQSVPAMAATKVSKVALNKTSVKVAVGKVTKLSTVVYPTSLASSAKVTWSSSNKSVATVSYLGYVKGYKNGTTTVTATIKVAGNTYKRTSKVTVYTPVSKITLNKTSSTHYLGGKLAIKPTVYPSTASNKGVTYVSSNTKVATVTSTGVVTAKGFGKATISVKAKDGSGKKATVIITVKEKNMVIDSNDIVNGAYSVQGKVYDNIRIVGRVDAANIKLDGITVRQKLTLEGEKDYNVTLTNSTVARTEIIPAVVAAVGEGTDKTPDLTVNGKTNITVLAAQRSVDVDGNTTGSIKNVVAVEPSTKIALGVPAGKVQVNQSATGSEVVISANVGYVNVNGSDSKITVNSGAKVADVFVFGSNNAILGAGTVTNVDVKGDNNAVNTENTDVKVADDATGTTVKDETVSGGSSVTSSVLVKGVTEGDVTVFTLPKAYTSATKVVVNYGDHSFTVRESMLNAAKSFLGEEVLAYAYWTSITNTTSFYDEKGVTVTGESGSATKTVTFTEGPFDGRSFQVTVSAGDITINNGTESIIFSKAGDTKLVMKGAPSQELSFAVTY